MTFAIDVANTGYTVDNLDRSHAMVQPYAHRRIKVADLSVSSPYNHWRQGRLASVQQNLSMENLHKHSFRRLAQRDVGALVERNALINQTDPLGHIGSRNGTVRLRLRLHFHVESRTRQNDPRQN